VVSLPRRDAEPAAPVVDIEPVPTADELVSRGLATREPKGIGIKPEGHALLGEIMRRNAAKISAAEATRPPIRSREISAKQAAHLWAAEMFDAP
jgi:hypothetical protein